MLEGGLGQACAGMVSALGERIPVRVLVAGCDGEYFEPFEGAIPSSLIQGKMTYAGAYGNSGCLLYFQDIEEFYRDFTDERLPRCGGFLEKVLSYNRSIVKADLGGVRIVHAHDWLSLLAGVYLQRSYGCKLVWHVHSLQSDRVGYHDMGLIHRQECWGAEQADRIITVSGYTKEVLLRMCPAAEQRTAVVHNGIEAKLGKVRPFGSRTKVLFLGRMTGQKSPEFMVEVARELLKRNPSVSVILAGEGERLPVLREVVKFRNLQERVHFVGRVEPERVRGLLDNVDVLCLPSLSEPFGLVAMEAAMAGVEVIMSDRCGAAEVLQSAKVVQGFDRYEWVAAIGQSLAADSVERRRQVQKEAASRSWHDAAEELLSIYSEMLG